MQRFSFSNPKGFSPQRWMNFNIDPRQVMIHKNILHMWMLNPISWKAIYMYIHFHHLFYWWLSYLYTLLLKKKHRRKCNSVLSQITISWENRESPQCEEDKWLKLQSMNITHNYLFSQKGNETKFCWSKGIVWWLNRSNQFKNEYTFSSIIWRYEK